MKIRWIGFFWLFTGLIGCIGTDLVDEPLGTDESRLEISEPAISVARGETYQLAAVFYDRGGEPAPAELEWSSRDDAVATVSQVGLVTGVGEGQTNILVMDGDGRSDSSLVVVFLDPGAVASVVIQGSTDPLAVGASVQLTAVVRNGAGEVLTGETVTWSSSDPAVISVDDMGVVTAQMPGSASITAWVAGIASPPFALTVSAGDRDGEFTGRNGYAVSGSVTLLTGGDTPQVWLGSDFSAQNGPGLHVYLGKSATSGSGGVDLGSLQSTSGEQVYDIPGSVNPDDFDFVLIYCQPFSVVFGSAELE